MPQLVKPEPKKRSYTTQDVKDAYMNDELNARQYHKLMWTMSRDTFESRIMDNLNPISVVKTTMNHIWDIWNENRQAILDNAKSEDIKKQIEDQMKKTGTIPEAIFKTPETFGQMLWRNIETGLSITNVPGELTGIAAKNIAFSLGAPSWLSQVVGYAFEAATTLAVTGKGSTDIQATAARSVRSMYRGVATLATKEMAPAAEQTTEQVVAGLVGSSKRLGTIPEDIVAQGLKDTSNYANPLQAKLANFATESALKARGLEEVQAGAKLSAGQLRRVTHEETLRRAAALAETTPEKLGKMPKGTLMTAEQTIQAQDTVREPIQALLSSAQQYIETGDPGHGLAFEAAAMRLADPMMTMRASQTEVGRATEILKASPVQELLAKVHDIYAAFSPEIAANGNWDAARTRFAQKILELGNPGQIEQLYQQATRILVDEPTGYQYGQLFRQMYNAQLLGKPATWVKKTFGDIQGGFDKTLQYSLGGWLSKGGENALTMSDGPLAAKTMLQSMLHTMGFSIAPETKAALEVATPTKRLTEKLAEFTGKSEANRLSGFFDYGGDPEKWNVPGRVFTTITENAQQIGANFGMYMNAVREGKGAGHIGEQLASFVAERMSNPTKEMLLEGIAAAGDITYTAPLGPLGKAVQRAVQGWGPSWMITPFFHIPANIVNRSFSNIPVVNMFTRGLAADLESTGAVRDLALGRVAMGQLSTQFLWLMSKGGFIEPSGPTNLKDRQMWIEAGHHPHTFKFGDSHFPIAWLGPWGIQASIVADAAYMSDYMDQQSIESMAGSILIGSMKAVANEPFFYAWGKLSQAVQDPEKSGLSSLESGIKEMAGTVAAATPGAVVGTGLALAGHPTAGAIAATGIGIATGAPIGATLAREFDPFRKSIDNVLDDITQNMPLLRNRVPNRLSPLTGEREYLPAPWGVQWLRGNESAWSVGARTLMGELSPVQVLPSSNDEVAQHLQAIGATFPNFKMTQGTQGGVSGAQPEPGFALPVNLTSEESAALIKHYATRTYDEGTIRQAIVGMMNDPDYKSSTIAEKRQVMDELLRDNLKPAFLEFQAQNPDVAYRYLGSAWKKIADKMAVEDRPAAQQDFLQGQLDEMNMINQDLTAEKLRLQNNYNYPPVPPEAQDPNQSGGQ